jgi:hypothetical protein
MAIEAQDRGFYKKHTVSRPDDRTFMMDDRFVEMTTSSDMETTMVPIVQQQKSFYCPNAKELLVNRMRRLMRDYCRTKSLHFMAEHHLLYKRVDAEIVVKDDFLSHNAPLELVLFSPTVIHIDFVVPCLLSAAPTLFFIAFAMLINSRASTFDPSPHTRSQPSWLENVIPKHGLDSPDSFKGRPDENVSLKRQSVRHTGRPHVQTLCNLDQCCG